MAYITPELFAFFVELSENNEREWFNAQKERFDEVVQEPLLRFIADFAPHLKAISPHYQAIPKKVGGSLFRIHRDTRFARDGRPYKTNAGVHFRHEAGKDAHAPGFYLHLEPGQIFMGAGLWHPPTPVAAEIRQAMLDDPEGWAAVREGTAATAPFALGGESLKRPPRGVAPDHPHVEDLKRKSFMTSRSFTLEEATGEGFMDLFADSCRRCSPLASFLTRAVGLPY